MRFTNSLKEDLLFKIVFDLLDNLDFSILMKPM